jgi:hypothetical protein
MRAGLAFNSESTTDTEEQRSFWTMVATPMGAGDTDLAIRRGGERSALLVAVGAQVAHTAIEGSIHSFELNGSSGFQGEVILGIGGVDLMTGAAIDPSRIRICGLNVSRQGPGRNAGTKADARMACGTGCSAPCGCISRSAPVN